MNKDIYEIIHGIITGILIPFAVWLLSEIASTKKDLSDYKVYVAQELAKCAYRADIERVENKIDDLRNLVIREVIKKGHE